MTSIRGRAGSATPRVGMSSFVECLDCVRRQVEVYAGPYKPGAAFYQDFTDALVAGRRSGTDELSLQRCVRAQRDEIRQAHFDQLRRYWLDMPELHLPFVPLGKTQWETPSLTVGVKPELGLRKPDGQTLVVKLWLKKEPTADSVRAMHWLLTRHMMTLCPGGQAAVLDLRRQKLWVVNRRPYKKDYESWLLSEATGLAQLWNTLAKSA